MNRLISYVHSVDITSMSPSVNFVFYNALSIAEKGQEINLYVRSGSSQPIRPYLEDRFNTIIPENLKIRTFKRQKFSIFFYLFCILNLSRNKSQQLIITRTLGFLPYLVTLKKSNWKVYFETHDFYTDLKVRTDLNSNRLARKQKLEKLFLKKLDGIICLSNVQKQVFRKYYPHQSINVFHTGLIIRDKKKPTIDQKYLVYVGSLDALKGISNIFKLSEYLDESIKIKIIGGKSKAEIAKVESQITQKRLDNKLEITGWLDKKELHHLLQNAQAGLLPLMDNFFNRYLTVPLKLLDYYSFNLPVFATKLPSLEEFIANANTGLFVDWEKPEQAAREIESFLGNQDKMENARRELKDVALSLSWETRAQKQIDLLEEIF